MTCHPVIPLVHRTHQTQGERRTVCSKFPVTLSTRLDSYLCLIRRLSVGNVIHLIFMYSRLPPFPPPAPPKVFQPRCPRSSFLPFEPAAAFVPSDLWSSFAQKKSGFELFPAQQHQHQHQSTAAAPAAAYPSDRPLHSACSILIICPVFWEESKTMT